MADKKIQLKNPAGDNLFPKVRVEDIEGVSSDPIAELTVNINGSSKTYNGDSAVDLGTIYAPTSLGRDGNVLVSTGSGVAWRALNSFTGSEVTQIGSSTALSGYISVSSMYNYAWLYFIFSVSGANYCYYMPTRILTQYLGVTAAPILIPISNGTIVFKFNSGTSIQMQSTGLSSLTTTIYGINLAT